MKVKEHGIFAMLYTHGDLRYRVQERLSKGDIMIVIADLNAKVGSDLLSLPGHVMRRHGAGDRTNNAERFIDFCSFNASISAPP